VPETVRLAYDVERFPFAEVAAAVLGVRRLDELADTVLARKRREHPAAELSTHDSIGLAAALTAVPDDHPLRQLYHALVQAVVVPACDCRVGYTSKPKLRVQLAGTGSVSAWHRDADITGRLDYVTAWVPFVDTEGASTVWCESDYGRGDYAPIPVRYGEILLFDAALLRHGSVPNTTSTSRVSMDFRFTPRAPTDATPDAVLFARRPAGIERTVTRPSAAG
jgi:hypothetical protein